MKQTSRIYKVLLNFISSIGGQLLSIVLQFAVRTVFIQTLGKSYLGINGLFANILSMLSLAEMGVGGAIVYKLYDPVAKQDHRRIVAWMAFYKKMYRYIGIVIAALGLLLIPALPLLIQDYESLQALNLNAVFVYILYLADSVASYLFFAYKSAIITVNQNEYKIHLVGYLFTTAMSVAQIICLQLFARFEVYVAIIVIKTVLQNCVVAYMANRSYPYIKGKTEEKISKKEMTGVFKDCYALFIYKVNSVVLTSTDNIVLSAFLGLGAVAQYSNYQIFYTTVRSLFAKIYNAVAHSLGNLHTTNDLKHEYKVFETTMLITAILGGTSCVGIAVVCDRFIEAWIGSQWVFAQPFSCLLGLELFVAAYKFALSKYRSVMGLFQQAKYRPVAGMVINLVLSVALVKPLGISGVMIGTIAADWLTFIWYDPMIVHKFGFKGEVSVFRYYGKFLKFFAVTCLVGLLDFWICAHVVPDSGWLSVVVHAAICGITTPVAILLSAWGSPEFKYLLGVVKKQRRR